jgi:serine phosphatase RsbU (regulator of sigma subunit)
LTWRARRDGTAREIVDNLYGAVRAFRGAQAQPDDMTVTVMKAAPL